MNTFRMLRQAKGWTVREASRRAGCSAATVSRAERNGEMTIHHFVGLCRAYGLDGIAETVERLVATEVRHEA